MMPSAVEPTTIDAAAGRHNGPGRTVWLASYPKSGNTWMRAIITALSTHTHFFSVNQLGSGSQPYRVRGGLLAYGIDTRWLSNDETDRLRTALILGTAEESPGSKGQASPAPVLRKTHEVYRAGEIGREPFPTRGTRAAILIVRDPRDVACSYAPFFGLSLDDAIDALARARPARDPSPANGATAQPWGTWSSHVLSWLSADVGFPVHVVRYEDLKADAVTTLLPVFESIGLGCTRQELQHAVDTAAFDRLRESEAQRGFRETSANTEIFFRKGMAGGWRDELSEAQTSAIEADHAEVMLLLGYPLTTADHSRGALAEARESRRRSEGQDWTRLPESLNIDVREGPLPDTIPDAVNPRKFLHVNSRQVLVTFGTGLKVLVEDGRNITVDWSAAPPAPDSDRSWVVQGWGVTLAMLQRGNLSLHAATVGIGESIVAIAGLSGAGKSTTSLALRRRGHDLLIDDVTVLHMVDGLPWTTPYARNVHLLPDAADALGVDFAALPLLGGGRTKAAFRAESPPEQPHRIDRIVVLDPGADVSDVSIEPLQGGARVAALLPHAERRGLAPLILGPQRYFDLVTQLAAAVPVSVLRRPREGWSLDEVVDVIEASSS